MNDIVKLYDDYYSYIDNAFGKTPNNNLRDYILDQAVSGNALDLGCGDGRNSLFMAGVGLKVTAVDQSRVGIEKLKKLAEIYGVDQNINAEIADICDYDFEENRYNFISAVTVLDHLPQKDIGPLLKKIYRSLKLHGIFFAKVHTADDPGFNGDSDKASELSNAISHYFKTRELRHISSKDFNVISYQEFENSDDTHGKPHKHAFAEVFAQKIVEP